MASKSRAHTGRRTLTVVTALTTAAVALAGGSLASAGNGGGGGGVTAPKPPKLKDVSCLDRCAGLRKAATDGKVQLSGRRLGYVEKVKFPSKKGKGGATVKATKVKSRVVEAAVPDNAKDGKPRVLDEFGQVAKAPVKLDVVPEDQLPEPGSFRLADASVSPRKSYYYGDRGKPTLRYIFNGDGPTDVRVDLVRAGKGKVVRSWVLEDVKPNSEQTLRWNGLGAGKKTAKGGEYRFRIGGLGDKIKDPGGTTFGYYDHKFPVRGKHGYGDGLGAGRGHRGQDVFAKCGTPIEAARGGRVQFKGYQGGGAGNYVVIDGKKSKFDYVYMHLKRKAVVKRGEQVRTGQRIGDNGATGNASGCHLHFEMWSKPGWYQGGHAVNPTKKLKKWDRWS